MNRLIYWILLICGLLIVLGVCSCRSVKKSSKSHTVQSDSSATIRENRTVETTDNSTVVEDKDKKVTGNFNLTLEYEDYSSKGDSTKTIIQTIHLPSGKPVSQDAVDKIVNALFNDRLRKANLNGDFNLTDKGKVTTDNDKKESAKTEQKTDTKVEKKDEQKENDKSVKGIPVSVTIWIVAVLAVLVVGYFLYRKLKNPLL